MTPRRGPATTSHAIHGRRSPGGPEPDGRGPAPGRADAAPDPRGGAEDPGLAGPESTALLVLDMQVGPLAGFEGDTASLVGRVARAREAARRAGVLVVYVGIAFRPGHPEISPANQLLAGLLGTEALVYGTPSTRVHAGLTPGEGEVEVTRHRVGAFAGTDLDQILSVRGITDLVLVGYATSGVVLSTVRDAADRDYRLVVLEDGVADNDPVVERVLLDKVLPAQASVSDVATFVAWSSSTTVLP